MLFTREGTGDGSCTFEYAAPHVKPDGITVSVLIPESIMPAQKLVSFNSIPTVWLPRQPRLHER